jgi:hypothetical protein
MLLSAGICFAYTIKRCSIILGRREISSKGKRECSKGKERIGHGEKRNP